VRLAEAARTVGPTSSYYAIYAAGGPIGYAVSTVDTLPDELRVQDQLTVDIEALGTVQHAEMLTEAHLSRGLVLRRFDATVTTPAGAFRASGEVRGDSVLDIAITTGAGSPQHTRVRLQHPIVLTSLLPLELAVGGRLRVGSTYDVQTFEPVTLQERTVQVRVLAESTLVVPDSARLDSTTQLWVPARFDTVRAWKVAQRYGGVDFESWIDARGRTVSEVSPLGWRTERTAFEIAVQNFLHRGGSAAATGSADVIAATAVASDVTLQPETLAELRVVLRDVDVRGLDLAGGRQRLAGDTLTRLPSRDTAFAADLASEPLVQSDDPRIQAQARLIVGRERRAGPVAELLTRWVHDELRKEMTVSIPSALQVLEDRRGDCNEHTVLYVALARALGLPARTAAGLVYLRGRFYYHAWPEVWLGAWVAVDPTFGQFPADASHLRFTIGGLARQVELLRVIGRVRLSVVGRGE
jgi:transglutaminase-like putative cysteine protease